MEHRHQHAGETPRPHCCPCCDQQTAASPGVSRRTFLGGAAALGGIALTGLSWAQLAAAEPEIHQPAPRRPIRVKPVLVYSTYKPAPQTSWRSWGGIQTQEDADAEVKRIQGEIDQLKAKADFPLEFLPISAVKNSAEMNGHADLEKTDVLLVYAAAGDLNALPKLGKDCIFFIRHKSGPLYLHYEIISPRFLRQHTDQRAVEGIDDQDVVVDSLDEVTWRLRALCGLRNSLGTKILAIGGPDGWAQPKGVVPALAQDRWKLDIQTVTYEELGKLIDAARADNKAVALSKRRADEYLKSPGTKLETDAKYIAPCFLLDDVFRRLMAQTGCRAITINGCMGTIMPMAQTTACLTLSTLNDDGYLAFCESDFVVIPSGILLAGISGLPVFLNDPTYPHDGMITLAHCTAPRKLDGKSIEPAMIMTHFESDYGAAPKVNMRKGQIVTNIAPDFKAERWMGLSGEIIEHPLLPICRSQIDIRFKAPAETVAQRMPGFHWMTVYGDYLREVGYALKRIPIQWDNLG
ncbi:MAG: hypothetical protein ACYC6Y_21450 [Thermoguttaceae bacterium]